MIELAFVGWRGRLPPGACDCVPRLGLRDLDDGDAALPRILVLGDAAAAAADPRVVRRAADRHGSHVVLCLERAAPVVVAAWMHAGIDDIVSPEIVSAHLAELLGSAPQPLVDPRALVGFVPSPGSLAAAILDALARSAPPHRVRPLARALRWSVRRLERVCATEFGCTPRDLASAYAALLDRHLRAAEPRLTADDRAQRIGYSDRSALCRALARWRCRGASLGGLPVSQTAYTLSRSATDKGRPEPHTGV
jgi:AraC-like DNA-binding protein